MALIRVTKKFTFETAHALYGYDGLCKNLHGHSYILYVTVIGEPITDTQNKKLGMVIDFGDLKRIVKKQILDEFDHAIVLNKNQPGIDTFISHSLFERRHFLDYQPTCENMVIDFAQRIQKELPREIKLFSIKLHETATSFAEWYAEDNS